MTTYKIQQNIYNQYLADVRSERCSIGFNKWLKENYPLMVLKEVKE